jgi:hypothetical protein
MKTLPLPWASLWSEGKMRSLVQPVATIITSVYRGRRDTAKTDSPSTMNTVLPSEKPSSHSGALLVESDIRDGVRGILP